MFSAAPAGPAGRQNRDHQGPGEHARKFVVVFNCSDQMTKGMGKIYCGSSRAPVGVLRRVQPHQPRRALRVPQQVFCVLRARSRAGKGVHLPDGAKVSLDPRAGSSSP